MQPAAYYDSRPRTSSPYSQYAWRSQRDDSDRRCERGQPRRRCIAAKSVKMPTLPFGRHNAVRTKRRLNRYGNPAAINIRSIGSRLRSQPSAHGPVPQNNRQSQQRVPPVRPMPPPGELRVIKHAAEPATTVGRPQVRLDSPTRLASQSANRRAASSGHAFDTNAKLISVSPWQTNPQWQRRREAECTTAAPSTGSTRGRSIGCRSSRAEQPAQHATRTTRKSSKPAGKRIASQRQSGNRRSTPRILLAWSFNRRGQLKAEAGQDQQAILDFDEAFDADPTCWRALCTIAAC